jgi:5S rRNA maturation endonuclease (ribonuclease M5)
MKARYNVRALLDELGYTCVDGGENGRVRCPTPDHVDEDPSASIHLVTGLWKCFGCDATGTLDGFLRHLGVEEARDLLGRHWVGVVVEDGSAAIHLRDSDGWLPDWPKGTGGSPSRTSADWVYTDADGTPILRVSLRHPDDGKRRFSQSRWVVDEASGRGRWCSGRPPGRMPLYRLPDVIAAVSAGEAVWVVEGEKDADALAEVGVVATTTSGGAGNWGSTSGTDLSALTLTKVIVVADRDHGPGVRHAMRLRQALEELGATVTIVGAKVGKDAADHLYNSCGADEFVELPSRFGILDPESGSPHPGSRISGRLPEGLVIDFRTVRVDPDEWLPGLDGVLLKNEFNMLAGDGGMGKSTTVAGWIAALSKSEVSCLYLAERSLKGTRKKLEAAGANLDWVVTFDPRQFTDIRDGVRYIETLMQERAVELLVLDPVNHFLPAGTDGHKDTAFSHAIRKLLDLAAMENLTVLGLHHLNKDDRQDPIRRLTGGAGYVNKPAHVLGLGKYPHDKDARALVVIKTNADDGLFQGAQIYDRQLVTVMIDGFQFKVATSTKIAHDPECQAEDVLKPQSKAATRGTNTEAAEDELLGASWVPTNPDSAEDEHWYAQQLESHAGIRLDPKNVGKLLTSLYERGFSYHNAKPGKGGYKKAYWRKALGGPLSYDDISDLDDDLDHLLGDDAED